MTQQEFQPIISSQSDNRKSLPLISPPNITNIGAKRNHDACGIAGFLNVDRRLESGEQIKDMMMAILDRENGLGGGFAAYGVFPEHKDQYAIQILADTREIQNQVYQFLETKSHIRHEEEVPTQKVSSIHPPYPVAWRYFIDPPKTIAASKSDDYIVDLVMHINANINGAFCLSSGKNMAVFKGNGWSYEIADYYRIQEYDAYIWIGHSRFPTNTPGSWFGAHPFNILDWSVAHNGEITSYGTNKRYLEMFGYKCTLLTDTEVIAYLLDLLVRRHGNTLPIATLALAPPYYDAINQLPPQEQQILKILRMTYRSAFLNGPFSILVGTNNPVPTLMGLTDRKKLRPLIAAETDDHATILISSEEAAIRRYSKPIESVWAPLAGTPVIAQVDEGLVKRGLEPPFTPMPTPSIQRRKK